MDLKTRVSPSVKVAIKMWPTSTGKKGCLAECSATNLQAFAEKRKLKSVTVRGIIGELSRKGYTVKFTEIKKK